VENTQIKITAVLRKVGSNGDFLQITQIWTLFDFTASTLITAFRKINDDVKRAAIRLYELNLLNLHDILNCCYVYKNELAHLTLNICIEIPCFCFLEVVGGGVEIFGGVGSLVAGSCIHCCPIHCHRQFD